MNENIENKPYLKNSKAITTSIKATSRVSIKIKDNFYTVEYSEERSIPSDTEIDMDYERNMLWDTVNSIVDYQCEEILKTFR